MTDATRGALLVLAASLGFATLGTLAGIAYEAGMSPAAFVTLRAVLGAALLAGLVANRPGRWAPPTTLAARERAMLVAAVILNGTFNLALFAAFGLVAVGIVLAVYFCPRSRAGHDRTERGRGPRHERRRPDPRRAGRGRRRQCVGAGALRGRGPRPGRLPSRFAPWLPRLPTEQAVTVVLLGGAVMAAAATMLADGLSEFGSDWTASGAAWLAVVAAAVFGTAAAKVWVLRGLRLLGGTRTAITLLLEPVGGAILAGIVLGHTLSTTAAAGGLLILAAAVMVQAPASSGPAAE
jgi:drug/metabolite transporter (DMT)-like permease